ncbi:MAG: Ig domain-containing protein [Planctomycetota bacterium]|nr:Ig domain-containing protein [Planctomycetota bacterium]
MGVLGSGSRGSLAALLVVSVCFAFGCNKSSSGGGGKSIAPLVIVTQSPLPDAFEGTPYSFNFVATGGLLPYIWTFQNGTLPAGITLDTIGLLSGTPTGSGTYNFTVRVTDSRSPPAFVTGTFDLFLGAGLRIDTTSLPDATESVSYTTTLSASGGMPPYNWSLLAGPLPTGLSLSTGGVISGTPQATGLFPIEVRVTDTLPIPTFATRNFSLVVFTDPGTSTPPEVSPAVWDFDQRGLVDVCYKASDMDGDPINIAVDYSTDGGITYQPATSGPGGEGFGPLVGTSVSSIRLFVWDSWFDVGTATLSTVRVRISPSDSQPGIPLPTGDFTLDNRPGQSLFVNSKAMQVERQRHTMTLLPDGTVLVTGGTGLGQSILASAEIFSPITAQFELLGVVMTTPRTRHTATLLSDGTVLIVGGIPSILGVELRSAEIFDPVGRTFAATNGLMVSARADHATVAGPTGAFVTGGLNGGSNLLDTAEFYDPSTALFSVAMGQFFANRALHEAYYLPNDRLLMLAGSDTGGMSAEEFDPVSGTSPVVIGLAGPIETRWQASSLLADGTALVTGGGPGWGIPSIQNAFDQAFLYTSPTGYTDVGPMLSMRRRHTSTQVPDGRVLIAGGQEDQPTIGPIDRSETYDPCNPGFTATSPMTIARMYHKAVLLQDGRVLITGGTSDGLDPVRDSEKYHP